MTSNHHIAIKQILINRFSVLSCKIKGTKKLCMHISQGFNKVNVYIWVIMGAVLLLFAMKISRAVFCSK